MLSAAAKINLFKYLHTNGFDVYRDEMLSTCNSGKSKANDNDLIDVIYEKIKKAYTGEEKITSKKIVIYLNAIYVIVTYSEGLKIINIDKLSLLEKDYDEAISKGILIEEEQIRNTIKALLEHLKEQYDVSTNEDISGYIKEVERLEGIIKSLNKTLEDEKRKYSDLDSEYKKYKRSTDKKDKQVSEAKEEVSSKEKEIEELNKKITNLLSVIEEFKKDIESKKTDISGLETNISKLNEQIDGINGEITSIRETNSNLLKELEEKRKEISSQEKRIKELESIEEERKEDQKLIDFLLNNLLGRQYSMSELILLCTSNGFNIDADTLYKKLMEINKTINIVDKKQIVLPRLYGITEPLIIKGGNITLESESECIDLIAISDLHIKKVNKDIIGRMSMVYDYAASVGAQNILDLGDLFHAWDASGISTLDGFNESKKIIEDLAKKMPYDKNIYHTILGGNHDRNLLRLGIDPLNELESLRSDQLSLGYDIASLTIGEDKLALHHIPRRYEEMLNPSSDGYKELSTQVRLNLAQGKVVSPYINLLGHNHISNFDIERGIISIPSLTSDRTQNGAVHIKVYLDQNGNIKYIIFIPLVFINNKLNKVCEIPYQKKLTNK